MTGHGMVRWSATLSDVQARAAIEARRFGVPPTMIEAATRRRLAGDWRGACAAADVDVQLNPDAVRRRHGALVAERLLADLRGLAPDLLRWHLPRCGHGTGRLLGGLLVPLADYADAETAVTLAAATPRFALAAGQRIILFVLEGDGRPRGAADPVSRAVLDGVHHRSADRYSLRRHRMFWDAACASQLDRLCPGTGLRGSTNAENAGSADTVDSANGAKNAGRADVLMAQEITRLQDTGQTAATWAAAGIELVGGQPRFARWLTTVPVNLPQLVERVRDALPGVERAVIRPGGGAIVLRGLDLPDGDRGVTAEPVSTQVGRDLPVVPEAAWVRPIDADLLRFGLLQPLELHPLVAAALAPDAAAVWTALESAEWWYRTVPGIERQCAYSSGSAAILVRCGSDLHRVAQLNGRWQVVDHAEEPARELLLARLGGPTNACLHAAQYLNTGLHVIDLVEPLLEHGRISEALHLLDAHADASATRDAFVLPEGGTVGEALSSLRENTLRLRMILSGAPPARDTRGTRIHALHRRRSRKGEPARLHR
jgi:hypothetical protein